MECGVHSHRHGLRARESLTRVMLVLEAQALQEWCAVGNDWLCCVEAIRFCICGSSTTHATDES